MTTAEIPIYARFQVQSGGRTRDYYLGDTTQIQAETTVLDWESAPLAEVFFTHAPGEAYELELDGRMLSGVLLEKELFEPTPPPTLHPRSAEDRQRSRLYLRVELDATQRAAVEKDHARSLLVLGEAGFGKTTVALHRLARLQKEATAQGRPFKGLVLVPTAGLEELSRELLEELGCPRADIEVSTCDAWMLKEARRIFPKLPKRTSQNTPAAAIRAKRNRGLKEILPIVAARKKGTARRNDLLHLFGDRAWMKPEVIQHTQIQFTRRSEAELAHVDADRLATLDGRALDDGTPLEDANSIDAEDAPVLLELHRLRIGIPAAITQYDHVVLDEAQELAPLELSVIGAAVKKSGSITIAGDERQQTDDTACFVNWEQTCADLGAFDFEPITLKESYRCPPDVVRYARSLFETSGPTLNLDPRQVLRTKHTNALAQTSAIIEAISALDDPRATLAIVCRTPDSRARMQRRIDRVLPQLKVYTVEEVKGLEFDYVIIPDLSPEYYPNDEASKRALYVAVTRAIQQVWISEPPARTYVGAPDTLDCRA